MGLALTAVFSFLLGVLMAVAGARVFVAWASRDRGAPLYFLSGACKMAHFRGFTALWVTTTDGDLVLVPMLSLADSLEAAVCREPLKPPPGGFASA